MTKTIKTYGMKEHAELIQSTFRKAGLKAEITNKGNVRISLKYRGISKTEVSQVIYDEELPIDDSQLVTTSKLVPNFGKTNKVTGVYSISAVIIRL